MFVPYGRAIVNKNGRRIGPVGKGETLRKKNPVGCRPKKNRDKGMVHGVFKYTQGQESSLGPTESHGGLWIGVKQHPGRGVFK